MPKISGLSVERLPPTGLEMEWTESYIQIWESQFNSQKSMLNLGSLSFEDRPFLGRYFGSLEFLGDVRS